MFRLSSMCRLVQPSVRILIIPERFAGHSKWQNIRHTKLANDQRRGRIISKYCVRIRRAAIQYGFDPKTNDKLRDILEAAGKANVPKETIARTLEKAKNLKLKEETLEIMGPGGCFILLDVETDNVGRTRQDIKKIIKKFKDPRLGILLAGAMKHAFDEKGVISISRKSKSGGEINLEKAEEIAIEAGAEEVVEDEDSENIWLLKTDKDDIFQVKGVIEKTMPDVEIDVCEVRFFPIVFVTLNDEDMAKAAQFMEELEGLPEATTLYSNVK